MRGELKARLTRVRAVTNICHGYGNIDKDACKIVRAVHVRVEGEAHTWVTSFFLSPSFSTPPTRHTFASCLPCAMTVPRMVININELSSYLSRVNYPRPLLTHAA